MCTLSWIRGLDGYHIFFNRDERRTRAAGIPPAVTDAGAVSWLAPRDGESHGTWIGANDRGITLALLNRWHESPVAAEGPWVSRGLLVRDLLDAGSTDAVKQRLERTDLSRYQPFTLAAFESGLDAQIFAWNGRAPVHDRVADTGMVLTSSGFDQDAAMRRAGLFARHPDPQPEQYEAVHASHEPERGPLSVCMHRPEAATVSFTRIDVTPERVVMIYVPGPPGETTERIASTLPRR
jgi:hypothetical protein